MRRSFPRVPFERYADDVICHCHSRAEAERLMEALRERFASCGLQLHPQKTQVVYCKDSSRRGQFPQIQFTFLGFCFRPRMARNRYGEIFTSFLPAVSPQALKRMRKGSGRMHLRVWMFCLGRDRRTAESDPAGLDSVLRTVLSNGAAGQVVQLSQ
jgi:hypothetical protein